MRRPPLPRMLPLMLLLARPALSLAAQPPGDFLLERFGTADGLTSAEVLALEIGPDGALYVGTSDGINRFDGRSFRALPDPSGLPDRSTIIALKTHDDALFAQSERGVYRIRDGVADLIDATPVRAVIAGFGADLEGHLYLANEHGVFRVEEAGLEPVLVRPGWTPQAVLGDEGGLWIGAAEGLFRLEDDLLAHLDERPVRAFLPDATGPLVGSEDGLNGIDGRPRFEEPTCFVTGLARARSGRIAASCGNGARIQAPDGSWESLDELNGLPGPVVRAVVADREGNLWLGMFRQGVMRLSEPDVRLWSTIREGAANLVNVHATGDELFIGGYNAGVVLDPHLNSRPVPAPEMPTDLPLLYRDRRGRLYGGTSGRMYRQTHRGWEKLSSSSFSPLEEDGAGQSWGIDGGRLINLEGEDLPLPPDARYADLSTGPDGRLYLLGSTRLWRLEGRRLEPVDTLPAPCEGGVLAFAGGSWWVGCGEVVYRRQNERWAAARRLLAGENLLELFTYGQELWAVSQRRVLRLSPTWLELSPATGLPRVSYLSGDTMARFGEWLIVLTDAGVLWVRPSGLDRPRLPPTPRILGIELRGQPISDLSRLGPEDTFLRIRLGTDRLGDPAETAYRFQLDGGEWSSPSDEDGIQLPGLTSGLHDLQVQAAVTGSPWSHSASLRFRIPPQWWQRLEVQAGALLGVVGMIVIFWRERTRRLRAQLEHLREEQRIRRTFGQFVTPEVAEEALAGRLTESGEIREITVLFADIRGFTPLTESLPPERLVEILNLWLGAMVEAVEAEGGMINKFIGDAVVAIFGAPRPQEDHADRAVRAALAMVRRGEALNLELSLKHGRRLRFGIGINSGRVIAGRVGTPSRMEYTVIGEPVNVAARIEALTRTLDVEVLVAAATVHRLQGAHPVVPAGAHVLKGVSTPVAVWEVQPGAPVAPAAEDGGKPASRESARAAGSPTPKPAPEARHPTGRIRGV